jgi:RNA polymerase II subunit A small phosphatase-like protein
LVEIVIFTASVARYAEPVIRNLNVDVDHILYRDSCTKVRQHSGEEIYVKDLSKLGRDLSRVILVDNSPTCYSY